MWRAVLALMLAAAPAAGETIAAARYEALTTRYGHGAVAGGEWAELVLVFESGAERRFGLPDDMVFEDVAPRLADLTGDGVAEAVVVESQIAQGARLAIWGTEGRIAAGPFIGTPHRWLAPLGAIDLDGDGRLEFAYVLRPHLDAVLTVVRFDGQGFEVVAEAPGLPSHAYRSGLLEGGVLDCGDWSMLLTADLGWQRVMGTTWTEGRLETLALRPYDGPQSFDAAAAWYGCPLIAP
ncbi:MAG: VCBS repeat-containing protein [Phaeovulum sp.]|uniref:FG-GAP repeat domain-containing protein n=1 Tax=Phaeovulum sp. TaxID=2934796 RepID=UPI002736FAD2|nr:VCBS repeat-containing protein [Phaeovulum sp.]MDP3861801.1 VCBS repeat-containing protein [Phaeovulum sp.]